MKRIISSLSAGFAIFCGMTAASADTPDPPLYVAANGLDVGSCQSQTAPCRTLSYALRRVGKHGRIRVAGGTYELAEVADVSYLLSGAIDVRGSGDGSTHLIGIPHEFAAELSARGFHVIADNKGLAPAALAQNRKLVDNHLALKSGRAATACSGGFAGPFPCDAVDLLSQVADRSNSSRGADIWGFADLNTDREYVIMGYSTGTAVYDVTDPESPREVGFIDGQTTTWRDIKVHQRWNELDERWDAWAYVTADNVSDGLQVIDLRALPHRISRAPVSGLFRSAHNVYLHGVDFATGLMTHDLFPLMIVAGSDVSDGRFRAYGLSSPDSPSFIRSPATPGDQPGGDRLYMHDGAAMRVTSARKDTQCQNASAHYCDVVFDFNESTVDIWDVTDSQNPARLSRTPYSNAAYTHSGWPSEDQQFLFVHDELDERDRGLPTTVRVFSIADLKSPVLVGRWTGPTNAIDHNGFVRGNRYYMSNYARGLTILDISDPANPTLAGRFDTYPSSDGVGFPGAWGAYPFLPSGNVAISDIDNGLFMVADRTLDVPQGALSFAATTSAGEESGTVTVAVQRLGGASGAVSVNWSLFGNISTVDDVSATSGTLNWTDGDSANKIISIDLIDDGIDEVLERKLIQLSAPTGGATLRAPALTSVFVSDTGKSAVVQFSEDNVEVAERGAGFAIATVQRIGSAIGAFSVDYDISGGDAGNGSDYNGPAAGTLNWADGDATPRSIEYSIVDDGNGEADEFFELTLKNPVGGSIGNRAALRVNILDGSGINTAPNAVAGGGQTVQSGTSVTLNGGNSNDPENDTLTYAWTQTMGPAVTLNNANSASASFTAPTVTSDTLLRFELTVTDSGGLSDTATTTVTVNAADSGTGSQASGGGGGALSLWGLLALWLLKRMRFDYRLFAIRSR